MWWQPRWWNSKCWLLTLLKWWKSMTHRRAWVLVSGPCVRKVYLTSISRKQFLTPIHVWHWQCLQAEPRRRAGEGKWTASGAGATPLLCRCFEKGSFLSSTSNLYLCDMQDLISEGLCDRQKWHSINSEGGQDSFVTLTFTFLPGYKWGWHHQWLNMVPCEKESEMFRLSTDWFRSELKCNACFLWHRFIDLFFTRPSFPLSCLPYFGIPQAWDDHHHSENKIYKFFWNLGTISS